MTSNEVVAVYHRRSSSGFAILLVAAFAIGALAGVATQGALDRASERPVVAFQAAADPSSTTTASGLPGPTPGPCPCTARNTMSDAAYAAMHPSQPSRRTRRFTPN